MKEIIVACEKCGKERVLKKSHYTRHKTDLCRTCSTTLHNKQPISQLTIDKKRKLMKDKFANGYVHPLTGTKRPQHVIDALKKSATGRVISEKTRKKLSEATSGKNNPFYGKKHKESSKRYGKNNFCYGKSPAHSYKCWYPSDKDKQICFRSTWEFKVAKYLDELKIIWEYEKDLIEIEYIFKGIWKQGTYRPDFYLPEFNKYIEVKGLWREGYKEKFDAVLLKIDKPIEIWDRKKLKELGIL